MIEPRTIPVSEQLEKLVADVPGWSPSDQLFALFNLVHFTEAEGDILELGSWCGRSASVLGLAAKMNGIKKVYCVDLFPEKTDWRKNADGTYSFSVSIDGQRVGAYEEQTVWAEPYEREIAPLYEENYGILDIFKKTIARNGLTDIVIPFKGDLNFFVRNAPEGFKCKLAFVDGDHGYDAVCNDIENVEKYLVTGGWICFDDAFSSYEGVNQAITDKIINSERYDHCQQLTRKFFVARRKQRSGYYP